MRENNFYIIECPSKHYFSYNFISKFINDNNINGEVVFNVINTNVSDFVLLSNKRDMKLLNEIIKKENITLKRYIEKNIDSILKNPTETSFNKDNKEIKVNIDDNNYLVFKFNFKEN